MLCEEDQLVCDIQSESSTTVIAWGWFDLKCALDITLPIDTAIKDARELQQPHEICVTDELAIKQKKKSNMGNFHHLCCAYGHVNCYWFKGKPVRNFKKIRQTDLGAKST